MELNAHVAMDPLQLIQRVADQARTTTGGADGVLVGLLVDNRSLRFVCGAGHVRDHVGELLSLDGSLSGCAIRANETLFTADTETDARVDRDATRAYRVRSCVCVPLRRGSERLGVLSVSSRRTWAFDHHDVATLNHLAEFMSVVIGASSDLTSIIARLFAERRAVETVRTPRAARLKAREDADLAGRFVANVLDPGAAEQSAARERVQEVLERCAFKLVFQPIFDLDSGALFGAEALVRFDAAAASDAGPAPTTGGAPDERLASEGGRAWVPGEWLASAHAVGLGVELEVAIVEKAITHLERLPPGALLTVNAGPTALASSSLAAALGCTDRTRVVIELTEQSPVHDYARLARAISGLRGAGARLAIDDAGAGFASLMHIVKLAPDFIKLDRQLTSGIELDPVRRSLAQSLVRFADETGAAFIAEGIENVEELSILRDLGIRYGQGFLLARPCPIDHVRSAVTSGRTRICARADSRAAAEHGTGDGRSPCEADAEPNSGRDPSPSAMSRSTATRAPSISAR